MTDWRQIQARIRRAKSGSDPHGELTALYEKTRDAMVAYELGHLHEKAGETQEAVRWYSTSAERFRRAQWKAKAQEALARLGAGSAVPVALEEAPSERPATLAAPVAVEPSRGEIGAEAVVPAQVEQPAPVTPAGEPRRHRRGRRGGRRHRRKRGQVQGVAPEPRATPETAPVERVAARAAEKGRAQAPEVARHVELEAGPAPWQARSRTGEPALASRLALLESQLRRLIASPLHRLDEAEQAPAGPGVFLLADSDLTTYYFVEACETLRIGIGILLRGGRRGQGESLRARFAEHLGISESRVSKYLKEHCVVRWLQLDEGASELAHFAIAVLRPALNV